MKALVDASKNPIDPMGMDVTQIGLGAPLRPPLVGKTPHPSSPSMEHDTVVVIALFLVLGPLYLVLY
jgi:hypothetical protein